MGEHQKGEPDAAFGDTTSQHTLTERRKNIKSDQREVILSGIPLPTDNPFPYKLVCKVSPRGNFVPLFGKPRGRNWKLYIKSKRKILISHSFHKCVLRTFRNQSPCAFPRPLQSYQFFVEGRQQTFLGCYHNGTAAAAPAKTVALVWRLPCHYLGNVDWKKPQKSQGQKSRYKHSICMNSVILRLWAKQCTEFKDAFFYSSIFQLQCIFSEWEDC